MRRSFLLTVSLALNLVLAAGWFVMSRHYAARFRRLALGTTPPVATQFKTNVVIRRQFFSWQQVESDDYPTYIRNLREIGCPEQTIRDIIIADVNALYAKKRANEIISPDQQWWRSVPDSNVVQAAATRSAALDQERHGLLTELLGTNWETGDLVSLPRPTHPGVALDGPVLGPMPDDVKKAVQQVFARYQQNVADLSASQADPNAPLNPQDLLRLKAQMRSALAQILSPQQLEEFLLRYSDSANQLRAQLGKLKYFNATPEEFRALWRASDPVDQQLELLAGATDPDSVQRRAQLLTQLDNAFRLALTPDRYQQYRLLADQDYREAYAAAHQAEVPEATPVIYDINQAAAEQLANIRANTNLTTTQQAIETKQAELDQLKATAVALGEDLPPEPAVQPPASKPPPSFSHLLGPNETLSSLSALYGVKPEALREANPDVNMDNLKNGQKVNIPFQIIAPQSPPLPPQ